VRLTGMLTLADVEKAARDSLDGAVWAYVAGGAGGNRTVEANLAAFDAIWLRPRVLRRTNAELQTAVNVLGHALSIPVLLAPTSPQRLLHEDAERATAGAASAEGTVSIVSTDSHYPFPAVSEVAPGRCWFQLYSYRSRASVEATIDMAVQAGASAIVVTVDANHIARRVTAWQAGFRTPPHVDFGTLRMLGLFSSEVPADGRIERLPLTWDDLAFMRRRIRVPLLVKGVLHPEDARRCVELGADGIVVSNHGGRQLDSVVPSLVALAEIVREVGHEAVVLMDGGVRSGVDVVKALALGAHAVCIGRPYLWGLSIDGGAGVEAVLSLLRREIEDTLRQLGLQSVSEIGPDCVSEIRWSPAGLHGHRRGPLQRSDEGIWACQRT